MKCTIVFFFFQKSILNGYKSTFHCCTKIFIAAGFLKVKILKFDQGVLKLHTQVYAQKNKNCFFIIIIIIYTRIVLVIRVDVRFCRINEEFIFIFSFNFAVNIF